MCVCVVLATAVKECLKTQNRFSFDANSLIAYEGNTGAAHLSRKKYLCNSAFTIYTFLFKTGFLLFLKFTARRDEHNYLLKAS